MSENSLPLRLLREPLLHFAVAGTLLFTAGAWFGATGESDTITVSASRIEHLAAIFERRWQRPPHPAELRKLVDEFVREEVLYREAVRLGLDRDDTVIRRRLRMKMEFLARDLVDSIDPGEEALRDYFELHRSDYALPARYSFEHLYFNSEQRPAVGDDVRIAKIKLESGAAPQNHGDATLFQREYSDISHAQVDRTFGGSFAEQLAGAPLGEWAGPVTSAYGEHLVRLASREASRVADFATIREQVLRDWQRTEKEKVLETQFEALRSNYRLEIAELPQNQEGPGQ